MNFEVISNSIAFARYSAPSGLEARPLACLRASARQSLGGLLGVLLVLLGVLSGCNTLASLNERGADGGEDVTVDGGDVPEPCTKDNCLNGNCSDAGVCECETNFANLDGVMGCEFSFRSDGCVEVKDLTPHDASTRMAVVGGRVSVLGDFGIGSRVDEFCVLEPLDWATPLPVSWACEATALAGAVAETLSFSASGTATEFALGLSSKNAINAVKFAKFTEGSPSSLELVAIDFVYEAPVFGLPELGGSLRPPEFLVVKNANLAWLTLEQSGMTEASSITPISGKLEALCAISDGNMKYKLVTIENEGGTRRAVVSDAIVASQAIGAEHRETIKAKFTFTDCVLHKTAGEELVLAYSSANGVYVRLLGADPEVLILEATDLEGDILELEMFGTILVVGSTSGLWVIDLASPNMETRSNVLTRVVDDPVLTKNPILGMSVVNNGVLVMTNDGKICHFAPL